MKKNLTSTSYGAWGLDRAAVAFGCRKAVPFGQFPDFPSRVPVYPQENLFPSPSDHTSLGFVSLLFFAVSLSNAVGCTGGSGVL
jgi:hypothetical protein